MSCKEMQRKFDDRLDDRLGEVDRMAFDEHVTVCAECRQDWRAYANAWATLQHHADIEPSFGFTARTLRRLTELVVVPSGFWRPVFRWAVLAAGVIVLGVGAWVGHERLVAQRRAEIYAGIRQADYLEDFDVIASLDQLNSAQSGANGGNKL
ncbi:MAG TPA: zf-HC2 domain-containing protein [Verrucomicrobiae bacterium]|nr:zf-HC2 domain-containing protein [Verrucomicrobiae bacterium]